MHRSYIFLAEGFEEIEALTVVDVMRRAGMDVKTVAITSERVVTGAHGIPVTADLLFKEADFGGSEWLILPGGMPGSTNLAADEALCDLLKVHKGKIAAICAAPGVVLAPLGLLEGDMLSRFRRYLSRRRCHSARRTRDGYTQACNRQRSQRRTAFCPRHCGQLDGRQRGFAGRKRNAVLSQINEFLFLSASPCSLPLPFSHFTGEMVVR